MAPSAKVRMSTGVKQWLARQPDESRAQIVRALHQWSLRQQKSDVTVTRIEIRAGRIKVFFY